MERNFETVLVEQCAPTLAGVKPANLYRFCAKNMEHVRRDVVRWNQRLSAYGLCITILKECPAANAAMIYVYREGWLKEILSDADNLAFLQQAGYTCSNTSQMLEQLSQRLCLEQDYPHEIGLFLGFPLCDVVGFIQNRGWNYTCCGYWKSYSDPNIAQRCFACYRKCTDIYKKMYQQGTPVIQLIVAA